MRAARRAIPLAAIPGTAAAASKLPQMDFANPLTVSQVVWMAIIMAALYAMLRTWLLPRIGAVIADRQARIRGDLDAAEEASRSAQAAVAELDRAIAEARSESERTVNAAIEHAKSLARAQAEASNAVLQTELARAEQQIAQARGDAMASLMPIAEEVASGLLERLTGHAPDRARLDRTLADIQAI